MPFPHSIRIETPEHRISRICRQKPPEKAACPKNAMETRVGTEESNKFPPSLQTCVQVSPVSAWRLIGQTGAALGAAAGEDLTAVGRGHPLAEAVDLLAMELLGLIGTFRCHAETPPVMIPAATGAALTRHPFLSKMGAVNFFRASFDA